MGVLTHDIGTSQLFHRIPLHIFPGGIHMGDNIRVAVTLVGLLILNRSARVTLFGPVIHVEECFPITGFIAQRPDDDRWMVLVSFHQTNHTIHMLRVPFGKVGYIVGSVTQSV